MKKILAMMMVMLIAVTAVFAEAPAVEAGIAGATGFTASTNKVRDKVPTAPNNIILNYSIHESYDPAVEVKASVKNGFVETDGKANEFKLENENAEFAVGSISFVINDKTKANIGIVDRGYKLTIGKPSQFSYVDSNDSSKTYLGPVVNIDVTGNTAETDDHFLAKAPVLLENGSYTWEVNFTEGSTNHTGTSAKKVGSFVLTWDVSNNLDELYVGDYQSTTAITVEAI